MYRVWLSVLLYWLIQQGVDATLTPSGPTVSVDCGGQQTFKCSVTGVSAQWTITGLDGITEITANGATLAGSSSRVTTTDSSGLVQNSTITITGFTAADDGGTVECFDQASAMVQGMTAVSVVSTTLASATAVMADGDQCIAANLSWSEPSDSNVTTSVSCTPSSSQCSSCTSSGCTIGGLTSSTSYTFSVTRSRSGCDDSTAVSSAVITGVGPPQCGMGGVVYVNGSCPSFTFNAQGSVLPSTVVVSYQLAGDPSSAPGSLNCDYPVDPQMCRLVVPEGTYSFTLTPQNNCGSPLSFCSSFSEMVPAGCTSPGPDPAAVIGGVIGGVVAVVIVGVSGWCITILIMSCTCFAYLGFLALLKCLCCPCCKGKAMKSSSKQRIDSASPVTPPAQPPAQPPADEYADPQAIRDRKEKGKEDKDKIQYAAIDFSAGAGSGAGEVKIHQKEEPVIYTTVQHV